MTFIDSHAHLCDEAFAGDRAEVLQTSAAAGVSKIVEIGCERGEWQSALSLCAAHAGEVFCALGLHPQQAAAFKEDYLPELKNFLANPAARALGEIGLDYAYAEQAPKAQQYKLLWHMLRLGADVKKPLVLHCRKSALESDYSAYDDLFALLKTAPALGGVMHCFSGRYEDAKRALDMGFLLGVTGIVGYKRNIALRETFQKIGLKYLLLETDCPYLPPQSKRGQRNDPSLIPEIAQDLAAAINEPLHKVADITTQNTQKLFGI